MCVDINLKIIHYFNYIIYVFLLFYCEAELIIEQIIFNQMNSRKEMFVAV